VKASKLVIKRDFSIHNIYKLGLSHPEVRKKTEVLKILMDVTKMSRHKNTKVLYEGSS
jgi:hypothetical protein